MAFHSKTTVRLQGEIMDFSTPKVMGILNVTPDSFYDGGKHLSMDAALEKCAQMLEQGAEIIDIGGASSRPGAKGVTAQEECDRVIPVIKSIKARFPTIRISLDTYHAQVAEQGMEAGASLINDITAGEGDPLMLDTVAKYNIPYVIMHMQGRPETMQNSPSYDDVLLEVTHYLSERLSMCREKGIKDVIVDPGFGFGKSLEHNYRLLSQLEHLKLLGVPMLVGVSRKSMIQKVLDLPADKALNGTTALHMAALMNGAQVLRVHDVKEAVECVKLYQALLAYGR